jgi:hypothetical protein
LLTFAIFRQDRYVSSFSRKGHVVQVLLVTLKIKPEQRPQFLAAVEDDATSSVRDEPGCLRFEAFQGATDPDTYHSLGRRERRPARSTGPWWA